MHQFTNSFSTETIFEMALLEKDNYSNFTLSDQPHQSISRDLSDAELVYTIFEVLVAVISTWGNLLIIASFVRDRHLRTPTNMYIFSLALADLFISVIGIPIYLYSMITSLPSDYFSCLLVNTWILMLCTVSIFHLVAVSFDRYMAVVWLRRANSPKERMRQAASSIATAWIFGTIIGFLPLLGWNRGPPATNLCDFMEIMDLRYLLFLFYFTIITPTFLMAFFYVSIFYIVRRQDKRMARRSRFGSESDTGGPSYPALLERTGSMIRFSSLKTPNNGGKLQQRTMKKSSKTLDPGSNSNEASSSNNTQCKENIISANGYRRRSFVVQKDSIKKKATKSTRVILSFMLVILSFFTSWYPLYILNAITYYAPQHRIDQAAFYACIVLSHLSSAINPLIYARTMPGFKEVLLETLYCEKPGTRRRRQSSFSLLNNGTNFKFTTTRHGDS